MVEAFDVAIVGGGIVGLATARALTLARPGVSVVLLEKENAFARHQTGHNSGVIHSGVYYGPGSDKARYAVQGAREMVRFCQEHDLPVEVPGKLIVATDETELPGLARLAERGTANGVRVTRLDRAGIRAHEPYAGGVAALHVADTGICDFAIIATTLARCAAEAGADLRTGTRVLALRPRADGVTVHTSQGELRAARVVTAPGLYGDRLAAPGTRMPVRIVPFRGEYYDLAAPDLVRGLVYPVPDPRFPFLGVHLTRTVTGHVHVGPNAAPALAREGYRRGSANVRDLAGTLGYPGFWRLAGAHWRQGATELHRTVSRRAFADAARRLVPTLRDDDLTRSGAGVRAQAVAPDGSLVDDFLVVRSGRVLHVLNAPSPAATAALPIGAELARRCLEE